MTAVIAPAATIGQAWVNTLQAVNAEGGSAVNTLTTVTAPGTEDAQIRAVADALLVPGRRGNTVIQEVETVANTIFPQSLYRSPGCEWSAADAPREQALDQAAQTLYSRYAEMLPMLRTVHANRRGTYFQRMTHWTVDDRVVNQLADRVHYLRSARRQNLGSYNLCDIAVAVEGESAAGADADPAIEAGVQLYASTDRRRYGFPCLVHVDLSVHDRRLHMLAVYRHWYLVTKAYGNMLGLSRLLAFLCEQTGYAVGELAVVAGTADAERGTNGGRRGIDRIWADASKVGPMA